MRSEEILSLREATLKGSATERQGSPLRSRSSSDGLGGRLCHCGRQVPCLIAQSLLDLVNNRRCRRLSHQVMQYCHVIHNATSGLLSPCYNKVAAAGDCFSALTFPSVHSLGNVQKQY